MNFQDCSLFPENQQKLVITCAPYGPEWMPEDFPEDIPITSMPSRSLLETEFSAGSFIRQIVR